MKKEDINFGDTLMISSHIEYTFQSFGMNYKESAIKVSNFYNNVQNYSLITRIIQEEINSNIEVAMEKTFERYITEYFIS